MEKNANLLSVSVSFLRKLRCELILLKKKYIFYKKETSSGKKIYIEYVYSIVQEDSQNKKKCIVRGNINNSPVFFR